MNYWSVLKKKISQCPDSSLCGDGVKLKYSELLRSVERLSAELDSESYAIICKSKISCAIAILACEAAGKCAIPLPYEYGERSCSEVLKKIRPSKIITDIYGDFGIVEISDGEAMDFGGNPPSVILHTSGSTGEKKGVMLDSKAILGNFLDIAEYFPVRKVDKILIFRSLCHASALTAELLLGLYRGADIVFYSGKFLPRAIIELMEREKITVISGTPTAVSAISAFLREGECRGVRLVSVSGEAVNSAAAKSIRAGFPQAEIYSGYGLTEAAPRVAFLPAKLFDRKYGAAGVLLSSVDGRISDNGELFVRGDSIMRGYYRDSKESFKKLRGGWLHTGDCAYMGKDGLIYIKGRIDGMINRAGLNIYPAEIENALFEDVRVNCAVAYGYKDDGEERIGLRVCGDFSDESDVFRLCRERLPEYMMPSKIELLHEPEVTENGKIKLGESE